MDVLLIDIDSKIPNLALMQLSQYHKQMGDNIGFDIQNPDLVYISCIFSKNKSQAIGVSTLYPNSEVIIGGSGVDLTREIPQEAQKNTPDYSLYKCDYDIGFTTRGCIRKCPFCVVPKKEGKIKKWMHISEFHDPKHTTVKLLDNNIYAMRDWFFDNTNWAINHGLKLDITQGMDIRLIDDEIAKQLSRIKWAKSLHFAFDDPSLRDDVISGCDILKNAGINLRSNVDFYVLVGFNTTPEQDIERVNLLKSLGVSAFVMPFVKNQHTKKLARWANRRHLYWSCSYDDYISNRRNR